jgi:hypothetical protein
LRALGLAGGRQHFEGRIGERAFVADVADEHGGAAESLIRI